ncbi:MAG: GDSL-type esterase/lipase family protein [Dysgonomonas sp.]|nr:GDSL-type esterase/lipase family protein [Dysgonomonas sp.]
MSKTSDNYFGNVILFVALAISAFIALKNILPDRLFPEHVTATDNIVIDSLMINAVNDTAAIVVEEAKIAPDSTKTIEEVDKNFNPSLRVDGYQNLKRFYAKLRELEQDKEGKVRIAYFGDSMNDGDYIVQDVRSHFQEIYGGQGVGYVAISSLSAGARGSISHQYSKNWLTQSFVKTKKPIKPFGVDGQVFFAKDRGQSYWVKYKAQSQPYSTELNNPTLLYGRSDNTEAYITIQADKDSVRSKTLNPSKLMNALPLTSHSAKSLQVNFHNTDSIPIYGFNFDDGKGVHVDNFSIRGNSGLPLSILNPSLMNAFDRVLNYDLIILHYGANVLGYGSLNYRWYERNMTTVVENLRQCFPNADILIISTADKASKIDGEMQTDPAVGALSKAQRNYARDTSSGFINLYEVMGGNGSMIKWVNDKLANKDYTHFNGSGSKRIAKLIYGEIDKGYTKYKDNLQEEPDAPQDLQN